MWLVPYSHEETRVLGYVYLIRRCFRASRRNQRLRVGTFLPLKKQRSQARHSKTLKQTYVFSQRWTVQWNVLKEATSNQSATWESQWRSHTSRIWFLSPSGFSSSWPWEDSDKLEISWTWLKLISSKILYNNKSSARRQRAAVRNALGSTARQTSALSCWKSGVISGKLLNLPEPPEGEPVTPDIGTSKTSEGGAQPMARSRHTTNIPSQSPILLKCQPICVGW